MESVLTSQPYFQKIPTVPANLIREEYDGVPLFYKGYREVLSGAKTLEDIMAAEGLHALLVTYLTILL